MEVVGQAVLLGTMVESSESGWMRYRVYVDEAGDRGYRGASSRHFVLAGVVVRDADDPAVRGELALLRAALGKAPGSVLHFRRLTHSQKLKLCQDVDRMPIATLIAVIMCKDAFTVGSALRDHERLYLYSLRFLLERVSWFLRDAGCTASAVTLAHVKRFRRQALDDYQRRLREIDSQIHWPAIGASALRVCQPEKTELLQVADGVASAVFRAVEPDEYGNVEDRYLRAISGSCYRRTATSRLTSYGLKVFPSEVCEKGTGRLGWIDQL